MGTTLLNPADLSSALGVPFVLFVGSAMSGYSSPRVPTVPQFMKSLLRGAASCLEKGTYGERLLAGYALSCCGGKYSSLLGTTKFEEFLWQVEAATGRGPLNDLLGCLYCCRDDEFGPNQSAICYLLEKGVCSVCLTTNFDNSIELASAGLKTLIKVEDFPRRISFIDQPTLLKLHGDAKAKNCVATSPAMCDAQRLTSYTFLRDLLEDQSVLALGYSGSGDVDISPHLGASKAHFTWGVVDSKSRVPPFVTKRVICDLSATDPNRNGLLGLARSHGWRSCRIGADHEWETAMMRWCESIDRNAAAQIVVSFLLGQTTWPIVRLTRYLSVRLVNEHRGINKGVAYLQIGAYSRAIKAFKRVLASPTLSTLQRIIATVYLGFAQWRHGKLDEALSTLSWCLEVSGSARKCSKEEEFEIGRGLRMYLEVARDWMQLRRNLRKRHIFYDCKRVDDFGFELRRLPTLGFRDDILTRAVVLHLDFLIGRKVDVNEVQALFEEARDTMMWTAGEAVGRLLLQLSFYRGIKALWIVSLQFRSRRQWNYLRKCVAAVLHRLSGRISLLLSILDGPIFGRLVTRWQESKYRQRLKVWRQQRRCGVVEVE